ncbi:aminoglycoside phosphotransferase (APT) family kinase protein [Scopulibacillus darangshiensis]|uniref:Aminoglycoside phosphotransferase (APT) family kinase protein n=1 Tax=Scopulibacillus darangshiensis TaxID=442528 RepID=A0A4R2P9D5_9BACL|nr:aminoglycoside phosphotransferase family protein [Scopulibacillus darangshiensis]TCP31517.1 aminoglycoside phosphotransferase (APT) family kinase protein [Scopulibacillus darangshiensis]
MRSILDINVLEWVTDSIGPNSDITSIEPLKGGISSSVYRVSVKKNGETETFVLRLFTNEEWLLEEPDLACHEAESLQVARRTSLPVPELVAVDEYGKACGKPAVLMSKLAGHVDLDPGENWYNQLAAALVKIHTVTAASLPWHYFSYTDILSASVPSWSNIPDQWERAFKILKEKPPHNQTCLIHRDFHPANVLWKDGRITGIVDWVNACQGPAGTDLGHCRANLAMLHGVPAADQFLQSYESIAGRGSLYHPFWDLRAFADFALPGPPTVYQGWIDLGVKNLTDDLMKKRTDDYLISILERFLNEAL